MTYHAAMQALNNAAYDAMRAARSLGHPDFAKLRWIATETDVMTDRAAPEFQPKVPA